MEVSTTIADRSGVLVGSGTNKLRSLVASGSVVTSTVTTSTGISLSLLGAAAREPEPQALTRSAISESATAIIAVDIFLIRTNEVTPDRTLQLILMPVPAETYSCTSNVFGGSNEPRPQV